MNLGNWNGQHITCDEMLFKSLKNTMILFNNLGSLDIHLKFDMSINADNNVDVFYINKQSLNEQFTVTDDTIIIYNENDEPTILYLPNYNIDVLINKLL